ncbi:hypothetical protein EVAR_14512_1 [Eumeta japonica]|uniref:Uncharacterized protein n=1 Tax=Eumeta variegata TaxID=151549 RepID=A0A4C1U4N1_EUMVA|nr:hypothetical protein EVAR_14512_1 [Eumeta japonica]
MIRNLLWVPICLTIDLDHGPAFDSESGLDLSRFGLWSHFRSWSSLSNLISMLGREKVEAVTYANTDKATDRPNKVATRLRTATSTINP